LAVFNKSTESFCLVLPEMFGAPARHVETNTLTGLSFGDKDATLSSPSLLDKPLRVLSVAQHSAVLYKVEFA
jgi:hypothetical protein